MGSLVSLAGGEGCDADDEGGTFSHAISSGPVPLSDKSIRSPSFFSMTEESSIAAAAAASSLADAVAGLCMQQQDERERVGNIGSQTEEEGQAAAEVAGEEECGVCLEVMVRPQKLPCGHNFCEPCLESQGGPGT